MFPTALMPLMMIVIPRPTKKRVTVCCTHLKAKKGFEDVRLAQARHLLGVIEVPLPLPRSNQQDHPRHLNDHDQEERCERTILVGDFNAGLDEPVYLLVS